MRTPDAHGGRRRAPTRPGSAEPSTALLVHPDLSQNVGLEPGVVGIVDGMGVVDLDRRAAVGMAALIDAVSIEQTRRTYALSGVDRPSPGGPCHRRQPEVHRDSPRRRLEPRRAGCRTRDDTAAMYRRTTEAILEAWQRPGVLGRETPLPVGRGPAESALYLHLSETLVHGWDLAMATGQTAAFDDDVVEAAWPNSGVGSPRNAHRGRHSQTPGFSAKTRAHSIVWRAISAVMSRPGRAESLSHGTGCQVSLSPGRWEAHEVPFCAHRALAAASLWSTRYGLGGMPQFASYRAEDMFY